MALSDRFESERRHVTVLFADVSGSTQLVRGLDPEEAVSILSPTVELLAEMARRYNGTVLKRSLLLRDRSSRYCRSCDLGKTHLPPAHSPLPASSRKKDLAVGVALYLSPRATDACQASVL
jgi:hypothetical protein